MNSFKRLYWYRLNEHPDFVIQVLNGPFEADFTFCAARPPTQSANRLFIVLIWPGLQAIDRRQIPRAA